MGARRLANTLVKKNTYSTAINVLPNEIGALNRADVTERWEKTTTIWFNLIFLLNFYLFFSNRVKPYSEVPGPKGLPIIGNSWRFAPFIGKFHIWLTHNIRMFFFLICLQSSVDILDKHFFNIFCHVMQEIETMIKSNIWKIYDYGQLT